VGKGVGLRPPPPRCRNGVDSPYLPACPFRAPGDPAEIAPEGEPLRSRYAGGDHCQKRQQAQPLQVLQAKSEVVLHRLAFEFHAPQTHADPAIEAAVHVAAVGPPGGEIVRRSADQAIQPHDQLSVQIVTPPGQLPNFGLEFLHGLFAHLHRLRRDDEAQEGEALAERRHLRLLGAEFQTQPLMQSRRAGIRQRPVPPWPRLRCGRAPRNRRRTARSGGHARGDASPAGGPPGSLYILIHVREHPLFARQGADVICEIPISFPQAALGTDIEVPTLEGKIKMKVPPGTQTGKVFRLRGKGIASLRSGSRGDQLVHVIVETPRQLSPKQRALLEEFARLDGENVHPMSKGFFDKVKELFG